MQLASAACCSTSAMSILPYFTTLAPGEESPFVIRVPLTSAIERYRIGFRTEDGRVLSHVDRRSPDSIAQKQVP